MSKYKRVKCGHGLTLSVQAGTSIYSTPRDDVGPYTEVEVGFPSEVVPELIPYAECPEDGYTETVYPYVPYALVRKVIYVRGGMIDGELPPPDEKAAKIKL